MGAGLGRFAWNFLEHLPGIRHVLNQASYCISMNTSTVETNANDFKIVYVMTDFVEANVSAWRSSPAFRHYFEEGVLDVAVFDAEEGIINGGVKSGTLEKTVELHMLESGVILSKLSPSVNPLLAIANYFFDRFELAPYLCLVFFFYGLKISHDL